MPIVSMVRVGGVEERELRVLTLVLADLVLELRRVGGTGDEGGRAVDDGWFLGRWGLIAVGFYIGRRQVTYT